MNIPNLASVDGDEIVARGVGPVVVRPELLDYPINRLRFDGEKIVSVEDVSRWMIEEMPAGPIIKRVASAYPDAAWPIVDCAFDDVLIRDGEGWRVKTDVDHLNAYRSAMIEDVQAFASQARAQLAGTNDPAKFAIYNQRAVYARHIKDGSASPKMIEVAKAEALRTGLATSLAKADANAMADVWIEKDERLAALSQEMDATETGIIAAINAAESVDAVNAIMATAITASKARVAEELRS